MQTAVLTIVPTLLRRRELHAIAFLNLPNWWLAGCAVRNTVNAIAQALLQADRTCQLTLEQVILDYREFGTTVVRGIKLE